jgi:transcription elongation GreA/GreB family factor
VLVEAAADDALGLGQTHATIEQIRERYSHAVIISEQNARDIALGDWVRCGSVPGADQEEWIAERMATLGWPQKEKLP